MPLEPVAITSGIASSINVTFKLAEFCYNVQAAPEEIHVFARLISRVRTDRAEVLRERENKNQLLTQDPKKMKWVNSAISDTDEALLTIGRIIENARIDGVKGKKVTLQHRFEWVLHHKEEFKTKQAYLSTCHQSLLGALGCLERLGSISDSNHLMVPPTSPFDDREEPEEAEEYIPLRSPSARRPKPQPKFDVLPRSPADDSSSFEDLWEEKFGAASISDDGLSRHDSAVEPRWDAITRDQALVDAAAAIKNIGGENTTTAALAESLQRNTTDARRRKRETYFQSNTEDGMQPEPEPHNELRPSMSRSSTLSRRRRLEVHFDED